MGGSEMAELYGNMPVELFKTARGHYVFDASRVSFLEIDEVAFDVLARLREAPSDLDALASDLTEHDSAAIADAVTAIRGAQADGWMNPYGFRRAVRHRNEDYRPTLSRRMAGLTIFVTTECNLGCSYCIYGGQYDQHNKLAQRGMSWDILRAALDFLVAHSVDSEKIRVDFFGGEPLMAFALIKRGVEYLKQQVAGPQPRVEATITTNGTILTAAMIDFLLEHRIHIQFSIDGDEEVHDRHRTFKGSGRPSFARILRNLAAIQQADPDYYDTRVRIKSVITNETVDDDDKAFFENPLIRRVIDRGHFSFLSLEPHFDLQLDGAYFESINSLAGHLKQRREIASERDLVAGLNPKQREIYRRTLSRFFDVQALELALFDGQAEVPFAKGCMTGFKEGAVNADGDISVCLKSDKGQSFVIGNVVEGDWYFDRIEALNSRFHHDWNDCKSCFVQRFCDLCYEKISGDPDSWFENRKKFCDFNRAKHRAIFSHMLEILELNPALSGKLPHIVETRAAIAASAKTAKTAPSTPERPPAAKETDHAG